MANITIHQTGVVTGDVGKIIAYKGQDYSEIITITHPIFKGCEYYLEYKYDQTIYRNKLNANNQVMIEIKDSGYAKCQLIACDIVTGNVLFRSKSWNLMIEEGLEIEPSHYPCSSFMHGSQVYKSHNNFYYNHGECKHAHDNKSIDSYDAYYKLMTELRNEEEIRFRETQLIHEELIKIKEALNISDPVASILNANEQNIPGKYIAAIDSTNFPNNEQEFVLLVTTYNNNILQNAYEVDGDNTWYRSGVMDKEGKITWTPWAQNITRVEEL